MASDVVPGGTGGAGSALPGESAGSLPAYHLTGVSAALAILGGILIVAVAIMVTVSVVLRWATSQGIEGDFEYVQMAMSVAAFAFFPYCQAKRGNIFVDTFTSFLPPSVQRGIDSIWDLVYAAFAGLICWRVSLGAVEAITTHTTMMMTGVPLGYAIAACSAMAGFLTVLCLVTTFQLRRRSS